MIGVCQNILYSPHQKGSNHGNIAINRKNEGWRCPFSKFVFLCVAKIQKATYTESILQVHHLHTHISEIHCRQNAVCANVTVVLTPDQGRDHFVSLPTAFVTNLPLWEIQPWVPVIFLRRTSRGSGWDKQISTHVQIIKENKNLPLPAIDWAALCARRAAALECCGWVTDRPHVSSRPSPHGQPQRNYGSSAASHHLRALQLANLTANDKQRPP